MTNHLPAKIFVNSLRPKDEISSTFLVRYISLQNSKDGKSYLNLVLGDKTGTIESRLWQNAETVFQKIERSDFVSAQGKLSVYQGRKQFIVSEIEKISSDLINVSDYIEKSEHEAEDMWGQLIQIVNGLTDVYIKDLLLKVLNEKEISQKLKVMPAGRTIHHSYQSGLLEHILSCTKLAKILSGHYQVNENFVIAGCILHDLCKVYELTEGLNTDYSDEGRLIGHLSMGVELVDATTKKIVNFPDDTRIHLKHIILSHHGEYEFGSPKIPQTSEALLVHYIDVLDSKMNSFELAKKNDNTQGDWTSYIKHLDRMVYRPKLPTYKKYLESREKNNQDRNKNSKDLKQNLGKLFSNLKNSQENEKS